jgi:hypothetical protein
MTDPVAVANLALSLLGKTTDALNALRERSQRTKDPDIKDQINTMYDNVLQLKEVISRLLDENKDIKRQLEEQRHPPEKPQLRQVGEANYYYKGEEGPFCQPCYDDKAKFVALSPQKQMPSGSVTRLCLVCGHLFYEVKVEPSPAPQRYAGPHGWMG